MVRSGVEQGSPLKAALDLLRAGDRWALAVAGLALFRVTVPLAALAASGEGLPGLPTYSYAPLRGDATGFYAASRELLSAATSVPPGLAAAALLLFAGSLVGAVIAWRRSPSRRWLAVLGPLAALSFAGSLVIREMEPPGAAVIGWSLLWAVPMLPLRVTGLLDPDTAFAIGLTLGLVAVAATTAAAAAIGLLATGRRSVGLLAAGLWALWPFVPGLVVGERAWQNGQWNVDVGLHLYTEPLSTALVAIAVALLLSRPLAPGVAAAAGVLSGLATLVKLSNGLIAVALCVLASVRYGWRRASVYAVGAVVAAPMIVAYWPKGYVGQFDGEIAAVDRPFSLHFAWRSWRDSLIFTPTMLAVLLPFAALGLLAVRGWFARGVLLAPIVLTAALYSTYYVTALHPRFLYVALPPLLALEAAGAVWLLERLRAVGRRRASPARA